MMLRSVIAQVMETVDSVCFVMILWFGSIKIHDQKLQCFRRGKSLGEALMPYGTGIAFGTGLGAFLCRINGIDSSRDAKEIEKVD